VSSEGLRSEPKPGEDLALQQLGEAVQPEVMEEVFRDSIQRLPAADAGDRLAFVASTTRYLLDWLQQRGGSNLEGSAPCIFAFSDYPREEKAVQQMNMVRVLSADRDYPLSGRVFVTTTQLADSYVTAVPEATPHTLCDWLAGAGLGSHPAVLFSPSSRLIDIFPSGIGHEIDHHVLSLGGNGIQTVDVSTVDHFLNEFHDICVRTPQPYLEIWEHPTYRIAKPHAERRIQLLLLVMAIKEFREFIVRREEPTLDGRADISISPSPTRWSSEGSTVNPGSAVLELKVLRARRPHKTPRLAPACPPSEHAEAVKKGMLQAEAYRKRLQCALAFLCCYDLREGGGTDDVIAALEQHLVSRGVLARRYPVYVSADEARMAAAGDLPNAPKRTRSKKPTKSTNRLSARKRSSNGKSE
jgi:hypothetical protein